jgi:hypothetical protein
MVGKNPLTDPRVKFMQLHRWSVNNLRILSLDVIPVSDGKDINLPVGERPPHTTPINASIRFVVVFPVQSGDADDSLFLSQVSADLWATWQEEEDDDGKNE